MVDIREDVQYLPGGAGVQGAGGLVGQDELRVGDDGPGNGRPLLLAAGDLVGKLLQQLPNAQPVGDGVDALFHLVVLLARQHQGQKDVVLQGEGVQQVEVLEHKAQVVPAEGGNLLLIEGYDVPHIQKHLAAGGLIQPRQDV